MSNHNLTLTEDELDKIRGCVDDISSRVRYRFNITKTDLSRRPRALRRAAEMMSIIYTAIINQGGFIAGSPKFTANEHVCHSTRIGQYEIWISDDSDGKPNRMNIYVESMRRPDGYDAYGQPNDLREFMMYSAKTGDHTGSAPMECKLAMTKKAIDHVRSMLPAEIRAWLMMNGREI